MKKKRLTAPPRKRQRHAEMRKTLIDAAVQIVSEQSASALTLRSMAKRVGVTQAAPYRHFSGKEAIMTAVAMEGFRALRTHLELASAAVAQRDPIARLIEMGVAFVDFAVKNSSIYRVMSGPEIAGLVEKPELFRDASDAFSKVVQTIIEAQKANAIQQGDPVRMTFAAWALAHGLATLHLDGLFRAMGLETSSFTTFVRYAFDAVTKGSAVVNVKGKP